MIQLIPAILAPTKEAFWKNVDAVKGATSHIHIDIADGVFVPNTTWADPTEIAARLPMDCELHFMVGNPLIAVKPWETVAQVKKILVHYEALQHTAEELAKLQEYPWELGIALNPQTPCSVLNPPAGEAGAQYSALNTIVLMGVEPGFQGSPFVPDVLNKVVDLRIDQTDTFIELDGGVTEERLQDIVRAGVDAVCVGSAIFGNDRAPAENIRRMREMIRKLT